jgi:hypothetical protein
MSSMSSANRCERIDDAGYTGVEYVNRFLGWAVFNLFKKVEKEEDKPRRKMKLLVLGKMTIYHHEAVLDKEYMSKYYTDSDQLNNMGGLTLVSKNFFAFGLGLMSELMRFTEKSLSTQGNSVIDSTLQSILKNDTLRNKFANGCRSYLKNLTVNPSQYDNIQDLFKQLSTKAFQTWAGEQSRKFKEKRTCRQVKSATMWTFRDNLNAITKNNSK